MRSLTAYTRARTWANVGAPLTAFGIYVAVMMPLAQRIDRLGPLSAVLLFVGWGLVLTLVVVLAPRYWLAADARRAKAAGFNLCRHCGFDMSAHDPDAPCPECGRPDTTKDRVQGWSDAINTQSHPHPTASPLDDD